MSKVRNGSGVIGVVLMVQVLVAALVLSPRVSAASIALEFNVPGALPDPAVVEYLGSAAERDAFRVERGRLLFSTSSLGGDKSAFYRVNGFDPSIANVVEWKLRKLPGAGDVVEVFLNGGGARWLFSFSDNGVNFGTGGVALARVVDIDTTVPRTYRLETQANSRSFRFLIDGVERYSGNAPDTNTTLNGLFWGDTTAVNGNGAAEWSFIRLNSTPAVPEIRLRDLRLAVDGAEVDPTTSAAVDLSRFDSMAGLGEVVVRLSGPGMRRVSLLADHDVDSGINGLDNEEAERLGVPLSGQSWEVDEPGFGGAGYFGDILSNFQAHALDQLILENRIDGTEQLSLEDIAMAMGWEFDLAPGDQGRLRFLFSLTQPSDGFYLVHRDPDSEVAIYLTATLERLAAPPESVPLPGSALLLASALLALPMRHARRGLRRAESA